MTRKRYKKLLMSFGIERDQAEYMARLAGLLESYEQAWAEIGRLLDGNGGAA